MKILASEEDGIPFEFVVLEAMLMEMVGHSYMYSGKDTLNKGHLCIKGTFQCTNLYSGNTFLPLKEDNLSIMDKMIRPNVSVIQRFHCTCS